ncbi:MAG: C25 family cysteine peptidase [PVC group bacterium]
MKKYLLVLGLLPLLAASSAAQEIRHTVRFPHPEVSRQGRYHRVVMKGLDNMGRTGEPLLPVRSVKLLIPYMTEVRAVRVVPGQKIGIRGNYLVEPDPETVSLDYRGPIEPTRLDEAVYRSCEPYPPEIATRAVIRTKNGYSILFINLYPVEYTPASGRLSYYSDLTVEVVVGKASRPDRNTLPPKARALEKVKELVDNKDQWVFDTYLSGEPDMLMGDSGLPPGDFRHVIITSANLVDSFVPLRDHRIGQGINSIIVNTDFIYTTYPGTRPDGGEDDQTRIRNFIIDAYQNWDTEYVLLGGDKDIIPPRELRANSGDVPADLYYAGLSGTFDQDADGVYGECAAENADGVDEAALMAEILIGRAAVANEAEVTHFVNKTISYEDAAGSPLGRACLVGEWAGFGGIATYGKGFQEKIAQGSDAYGYHTEGFSSFDYFNLKTLYDADWEPDHNWPPDKLVKIFNDGVHLVNHIGHSDYDYAMKLYTDDLSALKNTDYFFVYSQGCRPGGFDTEECFAEVITTMEHGAFAVIMNARNGKAALVPDSTDGASQRYNREFWDAFFGEGISRLGEMNQDSKEDNAYRVDDEDMRWCYYQLNLFGDPCTPIIPCSSQGYVDIIADFVTAPSQLCILVSDQDLNQEPGTVETVVVYIESSSETEPESLILTEFQPGTGLFFGCLEIETGVPLPDGILQVSHGDTITASYDDDDDGSGVTATATDTALVSLFPPVIMNVTSEAGCTRARIEWETDISGDSIVQYGTGPGELVSVEQNEALVTSHFILLDNLQPETTYFFKVVSSDLIGNTTTEDNGGICFSFTTGPIVYHCVSPVGSDLNDGSQDSPWRTIGHAIEEAADSLCPIVRVSAGTYHETVSIPAGVKLYGGYHPVTWERNLKQNVTIIDGCEEGSVVSFHPGVGPDTILSGFMIRNGKALHGGGVFCHLASPTLTNNFITGNRADEGGGIAAFNSDPIVRDSVIAANYAHTAGGAFYGGMSSAVFNGVTITGNFAEKGMSGISCAGGELTIGNCIIYGNWGKDSTQITDGEAALIVNHSCLEQAWTGSGVGNITADPLFLNPAAGDYHLTYGSPCIDSGSTSCPSGEDIDGDPRPMGGGPDMGADEWLFTDTDGDGLPDDWELHYLGGTGQEPWEDYDGDGWTNVEEYENGTDPGDAIHPCIYYVSQDGDDALDAAAVRETGAAWRTIGRALSEPLVCCGDTIIVGPGEYAEIINFYGKAVTLRSENPSDPSVVENTIINGQQGGSVVTFDSGEGPASVLRGFTIRCGSSETGGGICCLFSSPTLERNLITNNVARDGGGVYLLLGSPVLAANVICGNSADERGGGLYSAANPTLFNNIMAGNRAGYGGAIYFTPAPASMYGFPIKPAPAVIHHTIVENFAHVAGGGLYYSSLKPDLGNSIVWDNQAPESSQIYSPKSSDAVAHCDIEGGWDGGQGNINQDPLFADGEPLYHLSSQSPCIDRGTAGPDVPQVDIDGQPRPIDISGVGEDGSENIYDIGADEYWPVPGIIKPKLFLPNVTMPQLPDTPFNPGDPFGPIPRSTPSQFKFVPHPDDFRLPFRGR